LFNGDICRTKLNKIVIFPYFPYKSLNRKQKSPVSRPEVVG
jgi:hypothetical protein